jgi:hypothetical protein
LRTRTISPTAESTETELDSGTAALIAHSCETGHLPGANKPAPVQSPERPRARLIASWDTAPVMRIMTRRQRSTARRLRTALGVAAEMRIAVVPLAQGPNVRP